MKKMFGLILAFTMLFACSGCFLSVDLDGHGGGGRGGGGGGGGQSGRH